MNVEEAVEDVKLIKCMIGRTRSDISDIALFFILIGALNIFISTLRILSIPIMDRMSFRFNSNAKLSFFLQLISFIGTILIYLVYYFQIRKKGNDLCVSIVKIWGMLLIGGTVFSRLFLSITYTGSETTNASYSYAKTQVFDFIFPVVGFLVLGVVIHEKIIILVTLLCTCVYIGLIKYNIELPFCKFQGNNVSILAYAYFSTMVIYGGMILIGIYLKIMRAHSGNKCNS